MAHPDHFHLAPDMAGAHRAAERLFEEARGELGRLLPASAEILHVGATAIPGCLTKCDLDVVVRIARSDFRTAEAQLADRFARNGGSASTEDFAAFEDGARTPHLGIQLTVEGGAFDMFHRFAAALRADPELVQSCNALKRRYDGQLMEQYGAAKDDFITRVLRSSPV